MCAFCTVYTTICEQSKGFVESELFICCVYASALFRMQLGVKRDLSSESVAIMYNNNNINRKSTTTAMTERMGKKNDMRNRI